MTNQISGVREVDLSDNERRILASWCADCAARSLHLFEAAKTSDPRPRRAIEAIRAYAQGAKRSGELRSSGWKALRASREAPTPSAEAAAKAASYAAATAYLHALATPHQIRHILGPAAQTAISIELFAGSDTSVGDSEIVWAAEHAPAEVRQVVQRFPNRAPGSTRVAALELQLDAALRRHGTYRTGA
ncbi:putative immunity protein [Montanilutibacter psychrotolerans]|uniref:Imm-5-like domain-containing protein n=1 Tax=Montanilutibacter psychrotolerans TaxID=1327343 RepID=A0A3M8SQY2_9GAMM|nr:hypothetical protein EER27_10175 [Lysobacter psychrotolerans]